MKCYVRYNDKGEVIAKLTLSNDADVPLWYKEQLSEHEVNLTSVNDQRNLVKKDGVLKKKDSVAFVRSKDSIVADGEDSVKIKILGAEEAVNVIVGTKTITVDPEEDIELTADTPGNINLKVKDPNVIAEPISIEVKPTGKLVGS